MHNLGHNVHESINAVQHTDNATRPKCDAVGRHVVIDVETQRPSGQRGTPSRGVGEGALPPPEGIAAALGPPSGGPGDHTPGASATALDGLGALTPQLRALLALQFLLAAATLLPADDASWAPGPAMPGSRASRAAVASEARMLMADAAELGVDPLAIESYRGGFAQLVPGSMSTACRVCGSAVGTEHDEVKHGLALGGG